MTVIIMIAMLITIVPTTMKGGMLEEVMTVITVANKVFTNKDFNILNNNQQSSKDIFMKEDDEEEEEVQVLIAIHSSTTMNHHR